MERNYRSIAALGMTGGVGTTGAAWAAYWTLRLGAVACFVGHGAFGIITKEAWVPYFALVGIPRDAAFALMPVVGTIDILVGLSVLFAPTRIALVYMAVWALWTALLRPLTGEPFAETLERAGNYGVPLAFLLMTAASNGGLFRRTLTANADGALEGRTLRAWFAVRDRISSSPLEYARRVLAIATSMLLLGHGLLAASGKPLLATHAAFAGLSPSALTLVGYAEIVAALLVLARPSVPLLFAIAAWKIGTEMLFPMTGAPIWEFIERGGSYAAPIALALMLQREHTRTPRELTRNLLTPRRIS